MRVVKCRRKACGVRFETNGCQRFCCKRCCLWEYNRLRPGRNSCPRLREGLNLTPRCHGFSPLAFAVVYDLDTPDGPLPHLEGEYRTEADARAAAAALALFGMSCRVEMWEGDPDGKSMVETVVAEYPAAAETRKAA